MAIQFNYYNFKQRNQLKYEVDIDLSGLNVRSDARAAIIDEDTGEATETSLEEIKDGKVNFVFTGQYTDIVNASSDGNNRNPLPASLFKNILSQDGITSNTPVYTVGESVINTQNIDYGSSVEKAILKSEGENNTFYDIVIQPRHELMKSTNNDSFTDKSAVISDVNVLAALNLWSDNSRAKSGSATGFIDRKTFSQRISSLLELFQGRNIDIEIVEYPKSLTEDDIDENESFLNRNVKVGELNSKANEFIQRQISQGNQLLAPLSDENIVPFTLSVKEGFKGWFQTKEELYTEFLDRVDSIQQQIINFPFASVFVDSDDLDNLGYQDIVASVPTDPTQPITYTLSNGQLTEYPQTAFYPDTNDSDDTQIKAGVNKGKVYQTQFNPDNDRDEFVLGKNGRVFVKDFKLQGSPVNVYNNLIDAQQDITNGVAAAATLGFLAAGSGAIVAVAGAAFVRESTGSVDSLNETIAKIERYETWTNESIFPYNAGTDAAKFYFTDQTSGIPPKNFNNFEWDKRVARVLVPVDFGFKRVKKKRKTFGFTFTSYDYEDLGVRWVYINLIDTSTFTNYRKNNTPRGKTTPIDSSITNWSISNTTPNSPVQGTITVADEIDWESLGINVGDSGFFVEIDGALPPALNGYWQGTATSENTIFLIMNSVTTAGEPFPTNALDGFFGTLTSIITPFQVTQPDENKTPILIDYNIPYLPDDDKLRDLAFTEYGPFDQSQFAVRTRSGGGTVPKLMPDGSIEEVNEDNVPAGWEIFPDSSKEVEDMRDGIDIYNKVNFLLRILIQEFGESRVRLVETTRSHRDQNYLQLGGPSSNFLSWHNFGLAARIIVTQGSTVEPIEEGSEDFFKLFDIAESFTAGAANGDYGEPCNVVWCARLVAGSDIFDWEFLPIGVGHKEAWKFRDAAYAQQDPYYANAYVNVDRRVSGTTAVSVLEPNDTPPTQGPYIFKNSKAYREAIVIRNERYVDPKKIPRYPIPSNLVLKDLQEFLFLIQNKQDANGTDIGGKRTPDEWKSKNPHSFEQLIIYYSMIGNFSSARTLISGDYVRKFEQLVVSIAQLNPVAFVRAYLGEAEYQNVRISVEESGDNSFISLADGKYTTPVLEFRSIVPERSGNTFGQAQVDFDDVEFGQYQNGVFVPEDSDDIIVIKTNEPVLSGYEQDEQDNITISGGDAFILHSLIAQQIVESFNVVKDGWLNIDFKLMHDRITESPNSRLIPVLENEFGTIMSQDLLTFSQLREMYQRIAINSKKRYVDSGVLGVGVDIENPENESVFEKLVSNSQLSGIKKVKLSNESLIEDEPVRQIDVEKVVDEINRRNTPNVRDIL